VAEINLKIWRVYPLQSASLEIELNSGAGFIPAPFLFLAGLRANPGSEIAAGMGAAGKHVFCCLGGVTSSYSFEDGYRSAGSCASQNRSFSATCADARNILNSI
jgi:hypothetical protein